MYSAADDTRSAKCAAGIPPSMTMVSPVRRGLCARFGRRKVVGFMLSSLREILKFRLNCVCLRESRSVFSSCADCLPGSQRFHSGMDAGSGARVLVVDDAPDAVARSPVDLIVLDVLMPVLDGFEVCRRLRERGDRTPVLVLTARYAVDDRVTGLEAGADDYLVKPFALRELLARVQALLRRSRPSHEVLGYADLTMDATTRKVTRDGADIALTRIEFSLLELLLRNAEQVLSYEVILDRVWGYGEAPASNALQVFVGFLRHKLEEGGRQRLVHNVRGVGYVMRIMR